MIGWIFCTSSQSLELMKILDLGHLYAYHILTEGVTIFEIKIDGFLGISFHLESILVFDGVYLSMVR